MILATIMRFLSLSLSCLLSLSLSLSMDVYIYIYLHTHTRAFSQPEAFLFCQNSGVAGGVGCLHLKPASSVLQKRGLQLAKSLSW